MTTTYDLEFATLYDAPTLLNWLFGAVGVTPTMEALDGVVLTDTPMFSTSAFEGARDALCEDLGVRANVFVELRPKPLPEAEVLAFKRVVDMAMAYAEAHPDDDFALLRDGNTVLLWRVRGTLMINDMPGLWPPQRLALLRLPYTTALVPTL